MKIILGLVILSFIGIKYDPEWSEPEFFIKHKPNLIFEYSSPIGESDMSIDDLEGSRRIEELRYREYVGEYYKRDLPDNLVFFIIPISSTLILSGLIGLFISGIGLKEWKVFILDYLMHFVLLFLLWALYWNLGINGLVSIISYWVFGLFLSIIIRKRLEKRLERLQLPQADLSGCFIP